MFYNKKSIKTLPDIGDPVKSIHFDLDLLDSYRASGEADDLGIWCRSKFERLKHHINSIRSVTMVFESGKTSTSTYKEKDLTAVENLIKEGLVVVSSKTSYPESFVVHTDTGERTKGHFQYEVTLIKGSTKGFIIDCIRESSTFLLKPRYTNNDYTLLERL